LYDFSSPAIRIDSHNVQGHCTFLKNILSFILHYTQIACIATHFLLFWKSLLSAFNDQIFAPKIVKGIPQQQGSVPYSVDLGIGYLLEALFDK